MKRWGKDGGRAYSSYAVADDENKTFVSARVRFALTVERTETRAILLDAVDEGPVLDELQARRYEQSDLFAEGAVENLSGGGGARMNAPETEGCERRWLEGRSCAHGRRVDTAISVHVIMRAVVHCL